MRHLHRGDDIATGVLKGFNHLFETRFFGCNHVIR